MRSLHKEKTGLDLEEKTKEEGQDDEEEEKKQQQMAVTSGETKGQQFIPTLQEKREVEKLVNDRKFKVQIFDKKEIELIACAFKMKMKNIRDAIHKCDNLIGKQMFENENIRVMEVYREGLLQELIATSKKFIKVIKDNCIFVAGRCTPIVMFMKL